MNSYLSEEYLSVSEYSEPDWNSRSALRLLILRRYPLPHPNILWKSGRKGFLLDMNCEWYKQNNDIVFS